MLFNLNSSIRTFRSQEGLCRSACQRVIDLFSLFPMFAMVSCTFQKIMKFINVHKFFCQKNFSYVENSCHRKTKGLLVPIPLWVDIL